MNQRQSWKWDAEAAFKRIEEGMYRHMALPFPPEWVTPHRSGWTPAPDPRAYMKAKPDVYKGRDYEALTKAALRKPVGYWEDAPRGMKFGGSGEKARLTNAPVPVSQRSHAAAPSAPTTTPPADDEFEPVGTMPVVGDKFEWGGDVRTVSRIDPSMEFSVRFAYGTGEDGVKMDYFDQRLYEPLRILKRPTSPPDDDLYEPVGYWEDAPRGAKFGGGVGKALTDADEHGVTRAKPAPSSDSDLYEPIGTMPIVGDECVKVSHIQIAVGEHIVSDVGSRITITGPKRDSPFGEVFDHDRNMSGIYAECFKRGSWRILKRTMGR